MAITPKNLTKNAITPKNKHRSDYTFWGDDLITWGSVSGNWGDPFATFVNRVKNAISPTNRPKL